MQGNGIVSFELNGVKHTLFFGMKASRIIQEMSIKEILKLNGGVIPEKQDDIKPIDEIKAFAITVYAGMCNEAESDQKEYPSFKEAYLLTNDILLTPGLDVKIWEAFKNSKASENLVKLMNKGSELKKKTSKPTGTKSKRTPLEK